MNDAGSFTSGTLCSISLNVVNGLYRFASVIANIFFVPNFGSKLRECSFTVRLLPLLYTFMNTSSFAITISRNAVFRSFRCAGFICSYVRFDIFLMIEWSIGMYVPIIVAIVSSDGDCFSDIDAVYTCCNFLSIIRAFIDLIPFDSLCISASIMYANVIAIF